MRWFFFMIAASILARGVSAQGKDAAQGIADVRKLNSVVVSAIEKTPNGVVTPEWFDLSPIRTTVENGLKKAGIARTRDTGKPYYLFDFQVRLFPESTSSLLEPGYTHMVRLELYKQVGEKGTKNNLALIWSKQVTGKDAKENLEKVTGKAAKQIMDAFLGDYRKANASGGNRNTQSTARPGAGGGPIATAPAGDGRVVVQGFQAVLDPAGVPLSGEQQERIIKLFTPDYVKDMRPMMGVLTKAQKQAFANMIRSRFINTQHPLTDSQVARIVAIGPGSRDKIVGDILTQQQKQAGAKR